VRRPLGQFVSEID